MFGLVLIVGLGLAGLAVFMAKNYIADYQNALAHERAESAKAIPTVNILVSDRTLIYGEEILAEDVKLVRWPTESLPEGTFASMDDLFSKGLDTPRIVLRAMEKSEAILAIKVTEPGENAGITSRLERGMRAFAIKVDVASGVSGFLRPGDHVDVYWTGKINTAGLVNSSPGEITKLIETGIELVAVDQTANTDNSMASIARTVTVAVKPQQVAALAQAQTTGRLSLALVGANDDTVSEAIEVDQRSLLGLTSAPVAIVAAEEKICTIRTRRGAEVLNIEIPCAN